MRSSYKMYYGSRVQVLVSLLLVTVTMANEAIPTYDWTDETGKTVRCQKCPPGTYVAKHCSSTRNTLCQACPEEHYAQFWNYLDKCRFCNVFCQEGEQVQHECNSTQNRVCECQPGYRRRNNYCVKEPRCCLKDLQAKDSEECDNLVIEFIVSLNISNGTYRWLEQNLTNPKENKHVSQKRVRKLLKEFKKNHPGHPLLPQLLQSLNNTKMHELKEKLQKKFLEV